MTKWIDEQTRRPGLPEDVRAWVGEAELVAQVLAAVQKVDWTFPPLRTLALQRREFRPHILLTLLTYSYARGLYESEDIEAQVHADTTLRYLAARTFPDGRTLRKFRRQHRDLIKQCLIAVMKAAWRSKDGPEPEAQPAWPCYEATVGKPWFTAPEMRQIYYAAEERINRAVFQDGMAAD